jgi:hypothetical protein
MRLYEQLNVNRHSIGPFQNKNKYVIKVLICFRYIIKDGLLFRMQRAKAPIRLRRSVRVVEKSRALSTLLLSQDQVTIVHRQQAASVGASQRIYSLYVCMDFVSKFTDSANPPPLLYPPKPVNVFT